MISKIHFFFFNRKVDDRTVFIARPRQLGRRRLYTLDFPNAEVEDSFVTQLVPAYTCQPEDFSRTAQANAAKASCG